MTGAKLKDALTSGGTVVGPFLKLADPAVVEIAGLAGFDFAIIDLEHGPASIETAQNLVRAALLRGVAPLVRVSANRPDDILRALDIGAQGVHVPHIDSAEAARAAARAARYHPSGDRGVCRFVRAAGYSAEDRFSYFARANAETLVVLHVEGERGLAAIDDILQVPGVDVVFLGPYDLSQSLGVPGEVSHPRVVEKMRAAVARARAVGAAVGTFADDVETARRWIAEGVQYVAYSVDVGILYEACARVVGAVREEVAP